MLRFNTNSKHKEKQKRLVRASPLAASAHHGQTKLRSKSGVHKGGFSKGGFSNLRIIMSLLLTPPLLNPPL